MIAIEESFGVIRKVLVPGFESTPAGLFAVTVCCISVPGPLVGRIAESL
jgi:hypothetical protein